MGWWWDLVALPRWWEGEDIEKRGCYQDLCSQCIATSEDKIECGMTEDRYEGALSHGALCAFEDIICNLKREAIAVGRLSLITPQTIFVKIIDQKGNKGFYKLIFPKPNLSKSSRKKWILHMNRAYAMRDKKEAFRCSPYISTVVKIGRMERILALIRGEMEKEKK